MHHSSSSVHSLAMKADAISDSDIITDGWIADQLTTLTLAEAEIIIETEWLQLGGYAFFY